MFGVKQFYLYLFGRQFTLITDHKPLTTLLSENRGIPVHTSNGIQCWAITLSMYKYHITFKSSPSHSNADALSHLPTPGRSADPPVPAETVLLLNELSKGPVSLNPVSRVPILDELHQGHPGISHMKTLFRMFVWWPNMDSDVEEAVGKCHLCQSN